MCITWMYTSLMHITLRLDMFINRRLPTERPCINIFCHMKHSSKKIKIKCFLWILCALVFFHTRLKQNISIQLHSSNTFVENLCIKINLLGGEWWYYSQISCFLNCLRLTWNFLLATVFRTINIHSMISQINQLLTSIVK